MLHKICGRFLVILPIDKIAGRGDCSRPDEKQVLFNWVKKRTSLDVLVGNHAIREEHVVKDNLKSHTFRPIAEHAVAVPLLDELNPRLGKLVERNSCDCCHGYYLAFFCVLTFC